MKAVIYARYSSDNQREESIEAQTRAIKDYAKRNNINIIKTYADEAKTATIDNRPQFLDMIKDSKSGEFELVLVHKLDRFARNRYDSAFYRKELQKNGVKLISITENLDDTPEAIILESVLEGMAEYYSKNLAREVMKGMRETAYKGRHTGGLPPLGYDVTDGEYKINEEESKAVKIIFNMYSEGHKYPEILSKLNKEGYRTKRGKEFAKNSLNSILQNEKYIGNYVFNKVASKDPDGKRNNHKYKTESEIIRIDDAIPAIVDKDTFNKVQERLNKNRKHSERAGKKSKVVYLLSGIIFCGECGHKMVGGRKRAGRNKTYYARYECSHRKNKKDCKGKSISKEYVEDKVLNQFQDFFTEKEINKLVDKVYNSAIEKINQSGSELKYYEKKLDEIQKEIDNIVNAIAAGMFHNSMKEKMDKLEDDKNRIQKQLNESRLKINSQLPNKKDIKKHLQDIKGVLSLDENKQKNIIQRHVRKVIIYEELIKTEFEFVDANGGGGAYPIASTNIKEYRKTN